MHVVSFAVWYEIIHATAHAGTFVRVIEERVWLTPGAEATLERMSETSPVWCGHKDVLHLNKRNPFQEKRDRGSSCEWGANPSPAPALIALNIFNALIWKNESPTLTR